MRNRFLSPLITIAICAIMIMVNNARAYPLADQSVPPAEPAAPGVAITPLLQYQGRMTNPTTGQPIADGVYAVTFSLYDVASGGTAKWTETKNVPVAGGLFSTALGDTSALPQSLFSGQALWLGIKVGADLEATPRQAIVPVAYALSLVPGAAITGSLTSPALRVSNDGGGTALTTNGPTTLGGNVTINGSLSGGTHAHNGADITSGTVVDARIDAVIARDTEIMPKVLASDGAGSTLDADLLDGLHANVFASGTHTHDGSAITTGTVVDARMDAAIARDTEIMPTVLANDGAGSSLNADLLDGLQASSFASAGHTHAGTQYFVVGPTGFVPGSNVDYYNTYGNGGAYIVSGAGALVAPVHLPQGAVVTQMTVYFYDASASDLSVSFEYESMNGGFVGLGSVTTSGTPGYSSLIDTTISGNPIDNTAHSYLIYAYSDAWEFNLRIKAVVIQYTVSSVP